MGHAETKAFSALDFHFEAHDLEDFQEVMLCDGRLCAIGSVLSGNRDEFIEILQERAHVAHPGASAHRAGLHSFAIRRRLNEPLFRESLNLHYGIGRPGRCLEVFAKDAKGPAGYMQGSMMLEDSRSRLFAKLELNVAYVARDLRGLGLASALQEELLSQVIEAAKGCVELIEDVTGLDLVVLSLAESISGHALLQSCLKKLRERLADTEAPLSEKSVLGCPVTVSLQFPQQ